jgi:Peptidase family M1 domain
MMRAVILILLCNIAVAGLAQPAYWQQQINYNIAVELNDTDHTLTGYEQIEYFNNSPDTLKFIWFHLWPNAYKNDNTAFSDQLLENGRTDFYFSSNEKRGYINRLDFKVNGAVVKMEDHPQHQDIIRIVLTAPLAPGNSCKIETPFHVKLPYNISRGGYNGQSYQITQWYPKPAVYDSKGWHPMPYLNQGEFYSEFGNYKVQVTAPAAYKIAATGEELQNDTGSNRNLKTAVYKQDNVHDFAWFADKNFIIQKDTLLLPSGRIIRVAAYTVKGSKNESAWKNAVRYIKKAVISRSNLLGEYPYQNVSVVDADVDYGGGMEYPTITAISGIRTDKELEGLVEHEVGHNWLYGILASNERDHPWMDEGINTYYGTRYWDKEADINVRPLVKQKFIKDRMPANMNFFSLYNVMNEKTDQPIETTSEKFSGLNYDLIVYHQTSRWMQSLEKFLGREMFDSCMHKYYKRWQFKHPYPEDLKKVFEEVSGKNLDSSFALLTKKGNLSNTIAVKRKTKFTSFFSFKDTDKYKYIFAAPVAGFNVYDKLMLGVAVHNYTLPEEKFQFLAAPMYATGSKQLNGIGKLNYNWHPDNTFHKIEIGLNAARFSSNHSLDTSGKKMFENFYKIMPFIKFHFKHKSSNTLSSWIEISSTLIGEKQYDKFENKTGSDSIISYPNAFINKSRYINQVSFNVDNPRALYPFNYQVQLQQGKGFYRINAAGNYFFNYSKGGGMQIRLFASKFGFVGSKDIYAYQYQPKLLAGNGGDDYTYSNYFLGRSASIFLQEVPVKNGGIAGQQIMIQNTGGLKFRLDPYGSVQGYSKDWVAAVNLTTTLPEKLFPVKIPLKIFFDAGTYSEAWDKNYSSQRILFVSGLQLSLFKNILNIYAPLFYSKAFKEQLQTDREANKFIKKITFSIDIQNIKLKKLIPQLVF